MYLAKLDLSTDKFIETALELFNSTMSLLYDLLSINPTKGDYKGAYGTVSKLYTTFSAIGVSLMVLFFVYGFCRDSFDVKADLTLNSSIKEYIRLVIVSNLIANFITLIPKLYSWAITMLLATKKEADIAGAIDIKSILNGSNEKTLYQADTAENAQTPHGYGHKAAHGAAARPADDRKYPAGSAPLPPRKRKHRIRPL